MTLSATLRRPLALAALLQAAACATAGSSGMRAVGASGEARDGLEAWIARGDVAAAERELRAAEPRDPWGQLGLAMLARRSLDTGAELSHLLAVVAAEPDRAVGLVALERLAELGRVGPEVDRAIEEGLAPLAAAGRLQGVAAFRARVARISAAESSGNVAAVAQLRQEYGAVTEWTVVGPISPEAALDLDADAGAEAAVLPAAAPVLPGAPPNPARRIPTPDGVLTLAGEAGGGLHLLASDARLSRGGRYLLALWTLGSAKVRIDGATVAARRDFAGFAPATQLFEVDLPRGLHRLVVRFAPGGDPGAIAVGLARADGAPSDAAWSAPDPGPLPAPVAG